MEMTKRERVLAALHGQEVDHVPVGLWHHFYGHPGLTEESAVDLQMDFFQDVDTDFIKVLTDGLPEFPVQHITKAEQWGELAPLGLEHPWVQSFLNRTRRIVARAGGTPVFHSPLMPFTTARYACKRPAPGASFEDELVMRHLRENSDAVKHGLDAIAATLIMMFQQLMDEGGITGFFMPVHGAEFGRFQPGEYEEFVMPSDLAVINTANALTPHNILHCCSQPGAKNDLNIWRNYPSCAVNWAVYIDELSLVDGKAFFGGRTCMGGFQNTPDGLISVGTRSEIRAFTKNTIETFGKKGLILGADCTLPSDIPTQRIKWVVEAAREV